MTSQLLVQELSTIIQESKRKNSEVKVAAEKAVNDIKALPSTSETQFAHDVSRRPHLLSPLLLACDSKNAKLIGPAAVCLQRLAVSKAVPRQNLKDVVEALRMCSSSGLDVQLKVLQTLPSLAQNYSEEIRGELLSNVIQVTSILQGSKTQAVASTAAATLQQLIITLYDRLRVEDRKQLEIAATHKVNLSDGVVMVRPVAYDAYHVFHDLCYLLDGKQPQYVRFSSISQLGVLELLESVLGNYSGVLSEHSEQLQCLNDTLLPSIVRLLGERQPFSVNVRSMRVLNLILQNHLQSAPSQCESALALLNHFMEPDVGPHWKRILSLEVFRNLYADPSLILQIHRLYDSRSEGKKILQDNLNSFVRLASEKPSLIGLSHQSTVPGKATNSRDGPADQVAVEADAAGVIGGGVGFSGSDYVGISSEFSVLRTPCIEQLDKNEPNTIPETYIYTLALGCIGSLADGLAKVILPLSVHSDSRGRKKPKPLPDRESKDDADSSIDSQRGTSGPGVTRSTSFRKRTVPINPLDLKEHGTFDDVQTVASILDNSWPAVLAAYSTFLYSALDNDYYRSLVRSIQKFTQVSGLLRKTTPRDAFLTTLGKAAVPSNVVAAAFSSTGTPSESPSTSGSIKGLGLLSVEGLVSQGGRRAPTDSATTSLNTRNLLCLRALLNLAIALGPTLGPAWSIILETLQQADLILAHPSSRIPARDRHSTSSDTPVDPIELLSQNINTEIAACQAAATRLFESTADYPNDAFLAVLKSVAELLHGKAGRTPVPKSPNELGIPIQQQRRGSNFSTMSISTDARLQDHMFALNKTKDIATVNLSRFLAYDEDESGWNYLATELAAMVTNTAISRQPRLFAADILMHLSLNMVKGLNAADDNDIIYQRVLGTLMDQYRQAPGDDEQRQDEVSLEVHALVLRSLQLIVETCGDSLRSVWHPVLELVVSAFEVERPVMDSDGATGKHPIDGAVVSVKIARTAFSTVELICSDFIHSLPIDALPTLVDILYRFSRLSQDLNMALTAITFFWNVSDFIHEHVNDKELASFASIETGQELEHTLQGMREMPSAAIWLLLLLRLTTVSLDEHAQVRNGALQIILRIIQNFGGELSPNTWMLCLRCVLLHMLDQDAEKQLKAAENQKEPVTGEAKVDIDIEAWTGTARLMLTGFSGLFSANLSVISKSSQFQDIWSSVLAGFEKYLKLKRHGISAAVYAALETILAAIPSPESIDLALIAQVAELWVSNFPEQEESDASGEGNQDAYANYVRAFKEVYRLAKTKFKNSLVTAVTEHLGTCIETEDSTYSNDVESLTVVQTQVLGALSGIETDKEGVSSTIVKSLSSIGILPINSGKTDPKAKGLTFVAVSKACMDGIQHTVISRLDDDADLIESGAITAALECLSRAVQTKFQRKIDSKTVPLWRKATAVSVAILQKLLPHGDMCRKHSDIHTKLLSAIVQLAAGIMTPNPFPFATTSSQDAISADESFDTSALRTLFPLLTPALNNPAIPDQIRDEFTYHLFLTSLIHPLDLRDVSDPRFAPLAGLDAVRFGRTYEPTVRPRLGMAYLCLEQLLSLIRAERGPTDPKTSRVDRTPLARSAFPYILLRAALPLKAFIADQPLRGRMPMPATQRAELVWVLRNLRTTVCLDTGPVEGGGERRKGRMHLLRLYALVSRAVGVRNGEVEGEVRAELVEWMGCVGEELEL